MIDTVYKTVLTILNKENQGYVSPPEFNLIANNVQLEIFDGYFEDANKDGNRENRGLTNKGYGNLAYNQRHLITQFSDIAFLSPVSGEVAVPDDLYFIEEDGLTYTPYIDGVEQTPIVIEEVERSSINYLRLTGSRPTETYPVYESYKEKLVLYPDTLEKITMRYLRKPKFPNWTFVTILGQEVYDPTNASFQDFELHESELPNLVIRIMSIFGINLRETELTQIFEQMKNMNTAKENN